MVFEKYNKRGRFFISPKCSNNQTFVLLHGINTEVARYAKNSLYGFEMSLIDSTGIDISKLKNYKHFFNMDEWSFTLYRFSRLVYYNILDYKNNQRTVFTCFGVADTVWNSLEPVFFNSNWVERELVEFFGLKMSHRADTRNLLLDYNLQVNPLLRTYPTEGHQELFFNYLSYNLEYVTTEFVEL